MSLKMGSCYYQQRLMSLKRALLCMSLRADLYCQKQSNMLLPSVKSMTEAHTLITQHAGFAQLVGLLHVCCSLAACEAIRSVAQQSPLLSAFLARCTSTAPAVSPGLPHRHTSCTCLHCCAGLWHEGPGVVAFNICTASATCCTSRVSCASCGVV